MMRSTTAPAFAAGVLLLLGQAAFGQTPGQPSQSAPQAAGVVTIHEAPAVVESVDPKAGHVLLHLPDDTLVTVKAGPGVKNLAQLKPGDRVAARYTEAVLVNLASAGSAAASSMPAPGGAATGAAGGQPRPAASNQVEQRTTVSAIDRQNNTISFQGPDNVLRTVAARDPAMTERLRSLNVGDPIDVTYVESVAISLDPLRG
jgi:hypothetical protein